MYQLSNVTHAIIELIRAEFARRFSPLNLSTIDFSPNRPDATGASPTVHVYLYHVKECPHNRNLSAAGGAGPVPIQHTPLVLVLNYIITALRGVKDESEVGDTYLEQDYLGYVARAIHDYPILTPETEFPLAGADLPSTCDLSLYLDENTELELILRPAPPEETISFYSAGQQEGLRASLFVEARVALLEPEPPKTTLPGTVLSLGTFIAPMGRLGLVGSRSRLVYAQLGKLVPAEAKPGRVAVFTAAFEATNGANPQSVEPTVYHNNQLTIETSGTVGGDAELLLEGNGQRVRVPVLPGHAWRFRQEPRALVMNVLTTVDGYVNDASVRTSVDILPGLYSAKLLVRYPDYRTRTTNSVAFFVMPHVADTVAYDAANDQYMLSIVGAYLTSKMATEIEVSVGSFGLRRLPDADALVGDVSPSTDGTFAVTESTITFNLPTTDPPKGLQPVQLSVNGVPALPIYHTF